MYREYALSMFRKHIAVGSSHNLEKDSSEETEESSSESDQPTNKTSNDEQSGIDQLEKGLSEDSHQPALSMAETKDRISGSRTVTQVVRSDTLDLRLPTDEQRLTPFHAFIRKECVEAFIVSADATLSGGRTIHFNQVGIQCKFCKYRPTAARNEGAISFPRAIRNIYNSIDTWYRRHLPRCLDIPPPIHAQLSKLKMQSRLGIGSDRRYWELSAKLLGFGSHPLGGIRFCPDLNFTHPAIRDHAVNEIMLLSTSNLPSSRPVVCTAEADTTNLFLHQLFSQMEVCYYSEDDRHKKWRSKSHVAIGFPGFQCKHCNGQGGHGRYFPVSVEALASANTDRNIYNHITKCRSCPQSVKSMLQGFLREQKTHGRQPRGSRQRFVQRVWDRLHNDHF